MEIINLDSKRLVEEIKHGKVDTLIDWIDRNKDRFYKIAWSYLCNHEDIKDVFQNTLIKVYGNIDTLKNINYFETWYISILINECRQSLRSRKKEIVQENIEFYDCHIDQYNFFQEISSIDEIFKEAIILKYISGYSQKEISRILDIPIGTVKSRIYRGLRELEGLLKEV
jgi:RNA polymerase sigma-70 factor (ECF subfamily)